MTCNHETHLLMGTADGIVCRGCGRLFASFAEIHPEAESVPQAPTEAQDKPKRAPAKKKGGA